MVPYANFNLLKFPDKAQAVAKIVNVKVINLEQAPGGYKYFDAGVANKFVIDPQRQLPKAA
jgi:glutathione-independent formaldehyde dehydrogenase